MTNTPLQKLDDAIAEFIAETDDESGVLSGWCLIYQKSAFTADPDLIPLATLVNYTISPSTTLESGMGMARQLTLILDRVAMDWMEDGNE